MADFPEEITDKDLAFEISKAIWKDVVKTAKVVTDAKIILLKVKIKTEEDGIFCRHKYEFSTPPTKQLLGYFTSALEFVAKRQIVVFTPQEQSATILFSTEIFDENDDED